MTQPQSNQTQRADALFIQASRALLILNSGAIIAVLGLLQALYKDGAASAFKGFAVVGSAAFVVGLVSSIWMIWSSYEYADDRGLNASKITGIYAALKIGNAQRAAFSVGVICFLLGAAITLVGVLCAV